MSDAWYYASENQQRGPVSLDALRGLLASGQLEPTALVWTDGMAQWTPASSVPQLSGAGGAPASTGSSPPAAPIPLGYYAPSLLPIYAGFWSRVVAYVIDALLISIPVFAAFALIDVLIGVDPFDDRPSTRLGMTLEGVERAVNIVAAWLYAALMESNARQATVGKLALGLMVTDEQGQRVGFGRATGRHFGKYLSAAICLIGFLMVAFTERKQGLHDQLAGTLVIKKP